MTRKIKRTQDFDISLQIKNDNFIRPPRDSQRNWLLNRAIDEFTKDLIRLDAVSKQFVPGSELAPIPDRSQAILQSQDIMEDWQIPIMKAMAKIVTETHGDILEIGFGRGVSATLIQALGAKSHTVIECNDAVVARFHEWKRRYATGEIRLVHGKWQDVLGQLETYDGILFHTYPLNSEEYVEQVVQSTTFAEHFFPTAAELLRENGIFTYLTNEIDSFSREHQRLVFKYFRSFTLSQVSPLNLPENLKDAWWADSMVVIKAVK
jgi:guanidinoacetate N-methyltransferase